MLSLGEWIRNQSTRFRADDLHRILGCWNSLTEDLKHISLFIVMRQLQMNHSCTSMISAKTKLHREIHIFRDSQSVHLLFPSCCASMRSSWNWSISTSYDEGNSLMNSKKYHIAHLPRATFHDIPTTIGENRENIYLLYRKNSLCQIKM